MRRPHGLVLDRYRALFWVVLSSVGMAILGQVACGAEEAAKAQRASQPGESRANGAAADVAARLATMRRPWERRVHRITPREYEETLGFWAEKHAGLVVVETIGTSAGGTPLRMVTITDESVRAVDKQVCVVASLHGGPERTGPATVLHLAEWLLGDSPQAAETRRKQIVHLMPIINPEAYFDTDRFGNAHGIDPYTGGGSQNWDLNTLTYKAAEKAPEVMAFLGVVDRVRPEVIADIHGIGLQEYAPDQLGDRTIYRGQTMFEVTGSSYSNFTLRPWDWRVTEAMIAAGEAAGYGSDRFEADAQRGFWGPAWQPLGDRLWLGRPNFYTAQYAYAKYHTMLTALEVGWEASGTARLRGLLEIGNRVWDGEASPGYPVNRVKAFIGHFVTAWGTTATDRRRSRVELWQRQGPFSQAVLYPQTDGRDTYLVALTPKAAKLLDADKQTFLGNLEAFPEVRADAVRAFFDAGPEVKLAVSGGTSTGQPDTPIEHGLGLRLRLPYRNPKLLDVRLNGHLLEASPTDGFQAWFGNGFTQVQIHIPPQKASKLELLIATCAYVPEVERSYGWEPPAEVIERIRENRSTD